MKILEINELPIKEIKLIRFARFADHRGYFTESFRVNDFRNHPEMGFLKKYDFVQVNESFSHRGVVRGLHFQWNPYMGKLVRTLKGHMVDLVLDIRRGSPTYGKIIACDMPNDKNREFGEWIWVPPGFAHGNFFVEDTLIQYFCTGEYNPNCEAGISPLAKDLDWSLCDPELKREFENIKKGELLISDKDRNGLSLAAWGSDERARNFVYQKKEA